MAATFELTLPKRIVNKFFGTLARLGLAGKRGHVLTVSGRKTGKRYSTPVQLVFEDDQRWLVAPYGVTPWVRNARAAGAVELTRARRTQHVRVEEVDPETAAPILRKYLRSTPITKPYFDVRGDAPIEAFVAEAPRHPVFRIVGPA